MLVISSNVLAAKMYKWTDENGEMHFSQTPPPNQQKTKSEQVALTASPKGDRECCLAVRRVINHMLDNESKGFSYEELRKIYSNSSIDLTELHNFASHKASLGLNYLDISQQGFDTCLNAKFQFCRAGQKSASDGINVGSSSGTGFFVSNDGHILTNEHVAGQCKSITVQPGNLSASLIAKDEKGDLALLKVDKSSKVIATFRKGNARLGEEVVVAGFPYKDLLSKGIKITTGNVSSLAGMDNNFNLLQITAPIQPGNSGGPLIDNYGNVIGVIVSKLSSMFMIKEYQDVPQNINFAINGQYAQLFLKSNNVDIQFSDSNNKIETTQISHEAEQYTVEINCTNN